MDAINHVSHAGRAQDERGFSLVEVTVATMVLAVGLLPLVGIFAVGVQQMGASTPMMLAREKAREAIESVHAARDTGEASWATIQNVAAGGVFLDNAIAIKNPGPDGLVNTADDLAQVDQLPSGLFTREIDILPVNNDVGGGVNSQLREVRVIVRYRLNQVWRTYTLVTYISSYS